MLEEISRFYTRDIEYSVGRLTRAMESLMTIVIGVVILFILLALYMPVFNVTQVIQKLETAFAPKYAVSQMCPCRPFPHNRDVNEKLRSKLCSQPIIRYI